MTVDSLIEDLGGTSVVAEGLGTDPPVVSNWRSRGKIPSNWWPGLEALAAAREVKGITLQTLAAMDSRRSGAEVRA